MYKKIGKRMIGFFLSVIGLIVCAIPMAIIALLIRMDSKGPIIFKQKRLGKHQKIFTVYKFRTMCDHAYEKGGVATRSDDPRITRVGAILRRTSLDELPQMINILKGDMAIIGPRPILPIEFKKYRLNKRYAHRYDVLPGMFCTVDILNRAAEREVQFEMDADYVNHMSFKLDLRVFFGIISTVLSGENVYREEVDSNKNKKKSRR